MSRTRKRLILAARHYSIEPLGLLHLIGQAEGLGWDVEPVLVKGSDFQPLYDAVRASKPDLVGFSIWTGYHRQAFIACDEIRRMGLPLVIGGPHATYFSEDCAGHADWVLKGESFRYFRRLLQGDLPRGIQHDPVRLAEGFPVPGRANLYRAYPEYGRSPIKSMMATVGCPFRCSYCYAPVYNEMYNGYKREEGNERPVSQLIEEAAGMFERFPDTQMIYFQDDIFGFRIEWLREFVREWKAKIGKPWHCQIRLELTNDIQRLELFREGGCTGITLAVESGNPFLRQYVLHREMPDELIHRGVGKIKRLGFSLRLEQILGTPFSDRETELQTLALNNRLAPNMAWTSILSPYLGTEMGTIATKFGFYGGNNDDLDESFFVRSVLRHVEGGPASIEEAARMHTRHTREGKSNPLSEEFVLRERGGRTADVFVGDPLMKRPLPGAKPVATITRMTDEANSSYCDWISALQRVFEWCAKVPGGERLAERFADLNSAERTWAKFGELSNEHLVAQGFGEKAEGWKRELASDLGHEDPRDLPAGVKDHPSYFAFLPSGAEFAKALDDGGFFAHTDPRAQLDELATRTRHWLYDRSLYQVKPASAPIAECG